LSGFIILSNSKVKFIISLKLTRWDNILMKATEIIRVKKQLVFFQNNENQYVKRLKLN
jgi:hypothetical protein